MAKIKDWKIAVLLVSFQDSTGTHQRPLPYYSDIFTRTGTQGQVDYWEAMSNGQINLTGSQVFGFARYSSTVANFILAAGGRSGLAREAMKLFPAVDFRGFSSVIVVPDMNVMDAGASFVSDTFTFRNGSTTFSYGCSLPCTICNIDRLGNGVVDNNFIAHEMGHNFGLPHTNMVDAGFGQGWEGPGEYLDPWDVMGGANAYGGSYAWVGPMGFTAQPMGLNAMNLGQLGWFPDGKLLAISSVPEGRIAGTPDTVVRLEPLFGQSIAGAYKACKITFTDVDTGEPQAYWVEYRLNTGWDRGAPEPSLLIRKEAQGHSFIIPGKASQGLYGWKVGDVFVDERNNIRIEIESFGSQPDFCMIKVGSFVGKERSLGYVGGDIVAAGMALYSLDGDARPELVFFGIDNGAGLNRAFTQIASDVSFDGVPGSLQNPKNFPNWIQHENQKGDFAIFKNKVLWSNVNTAFALFVDDPVLHNQAFFRVAGNFLESGNFSWSAETAVPRKMSIRTAGVACALGNIDPSTAAPDVYAVFAEHPVYGVPKINYRVGKELLPTGVVTSWTDPLAAPDFHGRKIVGIGAAVVDLKASGQLDSVIFVMESTPGANLGWYCIGWNLNKNGLPQNGFSDWISVPGTFPQHIRDVSIDISTGFTSNELVPSMMILTVDKAPTEGMCTASVRLMKRIKLK